MKEIINKSVERQVAEEKRLQKAKSVKRAKAKKENTIAKNIRQIQSELKATKRMKRAECNDVLAKVNSLKEESDDLRREIAACKEDYGVQHTKYFNSKLDLQEIVANFEFETKMAEEKIAKQSELIALEQQRVKTEEKRLSEAKKLLQGERLYSEEATAEKENLIKQLQSMLGNDLKFELQKKEQDVFEESVCLRQQVEALNNGLEDKASLKSRINILKMSVEEVGDGDLDGQQGSADREEERLQRGEDAGDAERDTPEASPVRGAGQTRAGAQGQPVTVPGEAAPV